MNRFLNVRFASENPLREASGVLKVGLNRTFAIGFFYI